MGSLDLAIEEYERFGLDAVRHDEDIMALGARLSKDLYLASQGKAALEHAQDSTAKYEAAFKDSGGHYSGINAATMALAADMPVEVVIDRANKILEQLPPSGNLTPEDHYFIEATRAECYLILGEDTKTRQALRAAIAFDPLNYTAHASTIKQFKIILDKRAADQSWLAEFRPPRPLHYAGHIWLDTDEQFKDFPLKISDLIQRHDIGFGYGALAAGADIVIAEGLLEEGAELNVVLPASVESFAERSVHLFGSSWVSRYESCLDRAHSITILPNTELPQHEAHTILASQMAMGQAILRGTHTGVSAAQLLILDPSRTRSLTAYHAKEWAESGFDQLRLGLSTDLKLESPRLSVPDSICVLVKTDTGKPAKKFTSFKTAIAKANEAAKNGAAVALHFDLLGSDDVLDALTAQNLKGTILVSEAAAGYAALKHSPNYAVIFAGIVIDKTGTPLRGYAMRPVLAPPNLKYTR